MMSSMFSQGIYAEKKDAAGHKEFAKLPLFDPDNAQCYFDICIGNADESEEQKVKGRVVFEVFSKDVPKTAENFRALCTGEKGETMNYANNIFHKVTKGRYIHGGDIDCRNGTGGFSIYGKKFNDENIWYKHSHPGILTMDV